MRIDIDAVLETLKDGKTKKTCASLDKLSQILGRYYKSGAKDFSITTIGRLSEENGGIGYQSLRATANKHYRELIEVWAVVAQTTTKKPLGPIKRTGQDYKLLERISDPAVRALFGQIVRERDRYKSESNMLKNQTKIIIDKRPVEFIAPQKVSHDQLPLTLEKIFSDNEIRALQTVNTEEWLERLAFQANAMGQVKDEYGAEVLPRGFLTAIRKILGEIDKLQF